MAKPKVEYTSPYSVGKRQTLYVDANDPRVRGWKATLSAARAGAEIQIVNDPTISVGGGFSFLKGSSGASGGSYNNSPGGIDPINPEFVKPRDVLSLDAEWVDSTFQITFDFYFSDDTNKYVQGFAYRLRTSSYTPNTFSKHETLNKVGTLQTINFTETMNQGVFGTFAPEFTLLEVYSYDSFGNTSNVQTLNTTGITYDSALPAPVITANAITSGYTVDWTEIVQPYGNIILEEIVSSANTAPVSGYSSVYLNKIKPATVITGNTNQRWVRGRFAKSNGILGPLGNAISVTPLSPVQVDNTAPNAPASGTVTAGIDYDPTSSEVVGFNAYLDISWSAVSDSTLKGYRIRFKDNASSGPYTYVDSPGTGTSYRLTGLSIGTTYQIAIAAYDEFNNVSSLYTSIGTGVATGTPFIGKNVTTSGYFEAFPGGGSTANSFRFGYGVESGKRGLKFNSNNYWYIDSAASASLKVGGANNYVSWDGTELIVTGDIRAQKGNFSGNIEIASGGSLYSGTLSGNNLSGAGFILNNTGLTFNSSSVNDITTIAAANGLFTTSFAKIGNWDIGASYANSIYSISGNNIIRLNSFDGSITISGTGYSSGIGRPDANQIVFWSGSDRSTSSPFYVTQTGFLKATNATIEGLISTGISQGGAEMRFGKQAGDAPGLKDGLHIDSVNYWYSDATFKVGNSISATNTTVTIGGNTTIKGGEITLESIGTVETDNNNFAGDPTLTLNTSSKIVKGRRFLYTSNASDANVGISLTSGEGIASINGSNRPVKVGDILMVS